MAARYWRAVLGSVGVLLVVAQLGTLVFGWWLAAPVVGAAPPAEGPIHATWRRTDGPIVSGAIERTWMWGPEAISGVRMEAYAESPGGLRQVQYFDKSRMEITLPSADQSSPWYVTNGLLVVELVTGRMQLGHATYEHFPAAQINAAGDAEGTTGPTYAALAGVRGRPAGADGSLVIERIDRAGNVTSDTALASYGVRLASRVTVEGIDHQIAAPFWEFMQAEGLVDVDGRLETAPLFSNPFYATGLPIIEPYWATVPIRGQPINVLLQCFERRCLTYTPSNNVGWEVEAGNVGQHYLRWREQQTPGSQPTATATATSTATSTSGTCDPAYPDFCIPPPPPDLNCGDIAVGGFTVLKPDPHGLDSDGNGIGCEGNLATATRPGNATATKASTATKTATSTKTPTPTKTATPTRTSTATHTATATFTPVPTFTPTPDPNGDAASCLSKAEEELLELINAYRVSLGLNTLVPSAKLTVAAYTHSLDMATDGYFSHDTKQPLPPGQSGPTYQDRIRDAGYSGWATAKENIAGGNQTFASAAVVFDAWRNHGTYHENMIDPNLTQIGIGQAYLFGGPYQYLWTTDFAIGNDGPPSC